MNIWDKIMAGRSRSERKQEAVRRNLPSRPVDTSSESALARSLDEEQRGAFEGVFKQIRHAAKPWPPSNNPLEQSNVNIAGAIPEQQYLEARKKIWALDLPEEAVEPALRFARRAIDEGMGRAALKATDDPAQLLY
jgi:hypothetical protein